ncbi:hypothetical protein REPUB_Repub09cG0126700 [Reevesia pubescens]
MFDKVHKTCNNELTEKDFTYDKEKSLFTGGALPSNKLEFNAVLDDFSSKTTMEMQTLKAMTTQINKIGRD